MIILWSCLSIKISRTKWKDGEGGVQQGEIAEGSGLYGRFGGVSDKAVFKQRITQAPVVLILSGSWR